MRHTGAALTALCVLFCSWLVVPVGAQPAAGASEALNGMASAQSPFLADVQVPSDATDVPGGELVVRVQAPRPGGERYPEGAPVVVFVPGGLEATSLRHELPDACDDMVIITLLWPGTADPVSGKASDGTYDYRGEACIGALRDVVLYAAGLGVDALGRRIDDVLPVPVVHDNIGILGASNGGNIPVAAAALYGDQLDGYLRYVIQWETPVCGQAVNRDLGRIVLDWDRGTQGDFVNPRYVSHGPMSVTVDYADLAYDPTEAEYSLFHDGNGDGTYTTITEPLRGVPSPDLDLDGELQRDEDFPLSRAPGVFGSPPVTKTVYSVPVTEALAECDVLTPTWPADVATVAEAREYWALREAVALYRLAGQEMPDLEGMILANVRDHVQASPFKFHIYQAFDGWLRNGAWVQINPSPAYLRTADASLRGRDDLPDNLPYTPPPDWEDHARYCLPRDVAKQSVFAAAVWQMADRAQGIVHPISPGEDLVTFVRTFGVGRIAVRVETPHVPRYPQGAPVVVEASTWFVPGAGFHRVNDVTQVGAVSVSYMWPERIDPLTGARSEGTYDYGGPDSLRVLRDVIQFAAGDLPDVDGHYLHELVSVPIAAGNLGVFASSHAGVVGTNVLAAHGADLPGVCYFIGRENPTRDEMYPLELGHIDDGGALVQNPYYDPGGYSPTGLSIDYSQVGWCDDDGRGGRPCFLAHDGKPRHVLYPGKTPEIEGKTTYSRRMTQALVDNNVFGGSWPASLATLSEVLALWPTRITVHKYPVLATSAPELKVMLVFAEVDHVQAAPDKPHIRQAYDGFHRAAGLWVRLNPDRSYVTAMAPGRPSAGLPDNAANTEPTDWMAAPDWGFRSKVWRRELVWLASVAEMADRVQTDDWRMDLSGVLVPYVPVVPLPGPSAFLPWLSND